MRNDMARAGPRPAKKGHPMTRPTPAADVRRRGSRTSRTPRAEADEFKVGWNAPLVDAIASALSARADREARLCGLMRECRAILPVGVYGSHDRELRAALLARLDKELADGNP